MSRPAGRKTFQGRKVAVNWTLTPEAYNVLLAAQKANPTRSLSDLAAYAITRTFTDPLEEATEKMKFHQVELMRWKERKEKLETERREAKK